MNRRIFMSIFTAAILFATLARTPHLHAQSVSHMSHYRRSMPIAAYDCTRAPCTNNVQWNGDVHGAQTRTQINNSGVNTTDAYFREDMDVTNAGNNHFSGITVGIEKDGSSGSLGYCSGFSPLDTLYFFYVVFNDAGVLVGENCWTMSINDYNTTMYLKVSWFTSGVGGMFVDFDDDRHDVSNCSSNGPFHNACYFDNQYQVYNNVYDEVWVEDSVSGHYQYGSDWGYNQWQSTRDGSWNFQTGPSSCGSLHDIHGCPFTQTSPPQAYWKIFPGNSTHGGDLYQCTYDQDAYIANNKTCTFAH